MAGYQGFISSLSGAAAIGFAKNRFIPGIGSNTIPREQYEAEFPAAPESPEGANGSDRSLNPVRSVADLQNVKYKQTASEEKNGSKKKSDQITGSELLRPENWNTFASGFKIGYNRAQQNASAKEISTRMQNSAVNEREIILRRINDLKSQNKISGRVMRQVAYALREEGGNDGEEQRKA